MTALRVLHVGKFFPPFSGGIEIFQYDLMLAQRRAGLSVGAVVHDHRPGRPSSETDVQGMPVWTSQTWGRLLYVPLSPTFAASLKRAIQSLRPDLLHFHVPNTSVYWAHLLRSAAAIPWIVHWHADVVASKIDRRMALAYRFYRPWEQRFLARCAGVIATSPNYLNSSEALQPWRARCHVVPIGIDAARLPEPQQESLDWAEQFWPAGKFRVLSIGRFTYFKGHFVLISAMASLAKAHLCLIGDGSLDRSLRAEVSNLGLKDRISMVGAMSTLSDDRARALLATCNCLCLPSIERTESFGIVLLEAMRYGKPLVASQVPGSGINLVVQHEDNGLLVPPGDAAALAAAIARLATDRDLCGRLGNSAGLRFRAEFEMTRIAEQITGVYKAVLGGYTSSPDLAGNILGA